jgi:hypothetical protein
MQDIKIDEALWASRPEGIVERWFIAAGDPMAEIR